MTDKAIWAVARGLALIALALVAGRPGNDTHAVSGSAKALLDRAESIDTMEQTPTDPGARPPTLAEMESGK
jgi:hypothetical protein